MRHTSKLVIPALVCLALALSAASHPAASLGQDEIHVAARAVPPEELGDRDMAEGHADVALFHYRLEWIGYAAGYGESKEIQMNRERLAKKMAQALAKLGAPPVIHETAEFHFQKGVALVKLSKTPADFAKAVKEFQDAVNLAPWVFDFHFNLAVSYKSSRQYEFALNSVGLARTLALSDKDRQDSNGLRAEIEAAQELGPK